MNAFEWMEQTRLAIWVGESLWGYPMMLGSHVVGLAIVVGIWIMLDLRLLGRFSDIRIESLSVLIKFAWAGFLINALSGIALFTSQATTFITNRPFLIKIGLIFLAAIIAAVKQQRLRSAGRDWHQEKVPTAVKAMAGLSIVFWIGAIIAGRLVAYIA